MPAPKTNGALVPPPSVAGDNVGLAAGEKLKLNAGGAEGAGGGGCEPEDPKVKAEAGECGAAPKGEDGAPVEDPN